MLHSMYSGISGMKNFQTKLDVIGNNISNVNTYGFKKGRTVFSDLVSQQLAGASAPTPGAPAAGGLGGVNPKQVGLGVQLASIDTINTEGSTQTTGRALDLAITGDGFFQVNDGTNTYYTRAGNFYMDENGALVNAEGLYLGAAGTTFTVPQNASSLSIGADGTISYMDANGALNTAQKIQIAKFSNPEGLSKAGANLFQVSPNSGAPLAGAPGVDGRGMIVPGSLEMSNVDLSEEFTEMIVAQRGFQANTRIITTSDEILQELLNLKR